MKPIAIVLVSAAVSTLAALVVVSVTRDAPAASAQAASSDPTIDLGRRLDAIDARVDAALKSLDDVRMQVAAKEEPARVPVGEIEAAVARALTARGAAAEVVADAEAAPAGKVAAPADAHALFDDLSAGGNSWEDEQAIWKRAAEAGLTDELVALFEKRAAERPNDPEAQVDLGHAYLQKTFNAGGGPEAGVWAIKADKAYDKALALDDHNWEGRFSKAVSLSFWPAALGKQHEAIAQFQTLVKQQAGQAQKPEFAQSHLWLGNLYTQIGEKEKAMAAWQQGLALFPDDTELQNQIQLAQSH